MKKRASHTNKKISSVLDMLLEVDYDITIEYRILLL